MTDEERARALIRKLWDEGGALEQNWPLVLVALAAVRAEERTRCAGIAWGTTLVYFPTARERGWNEACAAIQKKISADQETAR